MSGGERTNLRLRILRLIQAKSPPPIRVEPKHRVSGPRQVPSDNWMDPEWQALLGPQCEACHANLVKGHELVDGKWCAECAARYSPKRRQAMGGGDWPPAA